VILVLPQINAKFWRFRLLLMCDNNRDKRLRNTVVGLNSGFIG